MAPKKVKGTKLDVFSGRAGRANSAIFDVLVKENPQKIKRILKLITKFEGLEETYYASLNKRLHALKKAGYVGEVPPSKDDSKNQTSYELRIKASLAMLLRENNMQDIIDKANDTQAAFIMLSLLNVLLSGNEVNNQEDAEGDLER